MFNLVKALCLSVPDLLEEAGWAELILVEKAGQ